MIRDAFTLEFLVFTIFMRLCMEIFCSMAAKKKKKTEVIYTGACFRYNILHSYGMITGLSVIAASSYGTQPVLST